MVTVDIVGGDTHELVVEGTYGDLLDAVELSRHEATVLLDGRPVPADAAIDAESVRVLRLIKGG
ncbi:small archaeal modifier protein 2 [Halococcus dombrowskii]|uniref:MoaD/ThiS family protein n=1 Tax=Halococcus dombrowskii TaxID=179637 RepID=A0AAV3SLA4_HALDO|nr:ubiquitin-like small modifier protein 2 [Halococcus dombrowskii]UOO95509.1 small archaeal modifier protein 2 [Halococcus dombrowskii]